jgi:hypothetical protein
MMAVTLCVPPRNGELCAPVRFELEHDSTVLEVTSRHRVTAVEVDPASDRVVVWIDITDPETSRPVDVRLDVQAPGAEVGPRAQLLGEIEQHGEKRVVYGTYLGVVSDEN